LNSIFDKIYNTIIKYDMLSDSDSVLIGVSGGADSIFLTMALLQIKSILNLSLGVAHINHGIRGDDADADQEYVRLFCDEYSLPYHTITLDIPNLAKEYNISEETAGRHERYNFFEKICKKYGYNKIAVAHNMNDSVETMLINLIRGSGLKGLRGIQPVNGNVIRPIIEVSRDEIEKYLHSEDIKYCTDITNYSDVYTRNKVRNKIIPLMQEINPTLIQTVFSNFDNLNDDYHFIESYADQTSCISLTNNDVVITKSEFDKYDKTIKKRIIFKALQMLHGNCNNIEAKHINILTNDISAGKIINIPNGISVEATHDKLVFSKNIIPKNIRFCYDVKLGNCVIENEYFFIKFDIIDNDGNYANQYNAESLYVDADKLYHKKQMVVRSRSEGDRIRLLGMTGTKKIKQLMSELHIQATHRNLVPILCADNEVVAVVPYRISEDYKVTESTKKILKIQMLKEI